MIENYDDLPEDSELAFAIREQMLRDELLNAISGNSSVAYERDKKLNYLNKVMAFHDAHELNLIENPKILRNTSDFDFVFSLFMDDINYLSEKIKVSHARRTRSIAIIVKLDVATKSHIHHLIAKIKEAIEPIELPIKKKEAIFKKLAALSYEIDSERTKGEAYAAAILEIAGVTGEAASKLRPVKDLLDSVGTALGKAKDIYEALKLEAPKEVKQLESPKKQLPAPQQSALDDEIPF